MNNKMPKVSIITPTHGLNKYLKDAWESLKKQTFKDFEWIIVPHDGAKVELEKDKRIRVIPLKKSTDFIGYLKSFACNHVKGEITIEFDHDDLLTPDALEVIVNEFEKDKELAFVYSNFAEFFYDHKVKKDWEVNLYNLAYGWKYRDFEYEGHKLKEARCFSSTAVSLSLIYFAPNHVRAWRTKDYKELGGHDERLRVADDHDLCCRFYLKKKMKHIDKCLYLYRIHGNNAWIMMNPLIQSLTRKVRDRYIYQLAERWAKLNKLPKIDLGGGFGKPEGYKSIDLKNADIIADLNKGIPLEDNSVGVVRAFDILEHLINPIKTMKEIHRVLVPGGWLISMTPSTDGRGAFQDPTHISYWNENSFWYYTKHQQAKYINNTKVRFQNIRLKTYFPSDYHKKHKISYVVADLVALKEGMGRLPGLIEI